MAKKIIKSTEVAVLSNVAPLTIEGVVEQAAQQPTAEAPQTRAARSNELMKVTVPAKETDQTLIVSKSVNGKDRWFAKSVIQSFEPAEDGKFVIIATRREFAYRDMEELAQLAN